MQNECLLSASELTVPAVFLNEAYYSTFNVRIISFAAKLIAMEYGLSMENWVCGFECSSSYLALLFCNDFTLYGNFEKWRKESVL